MDIVREDSNVRGERGFRCLALHHTLENGRRLSAPTQGPMAPPPGPFWAAEVAIAAQCARHLADRTARSRRFLRRRRDLVRVSVLSP